MLSFARAAAEQLDADTGRPESVPALEASQAAWEAFRDAQCGYIGSTWAGGSGTGSAIGACRIELARDRIDALFAALP
ncbi:MAG: lysozyme inhibitor LprI family protein [bacterium]